MNAVELYNDIVVCVVNENTKCYYYVLLINIL